MPIDINKPDFEQNFIEIVSENYNNAPLPPYAIPNKSGIYVFIGIFGQVLYIGKAKRIRNRLLSYWRQPLFDDKTSHILTHMGIEDLKKINIAFQVYAFLTESPESIERDLIQQYKPPFNIHFNKSH